MEHRRQRSRQHPNGIEKHKGRHHQKEKQQKRDREQGKEDKQKAIEQQRKMEQRKQILLYMLQDFRIPPAGTKEQREEALFEDARSPPSGWKLKIADDGSIYYYHTLTHTIQIERPTESRDQL